MSDVSVVIPCYNGARFISRTIESVLDQTDRPRELWVIDDGSTDDSAAIIETYCRKAGDIVRLIRQENAGESRARNVGIGEAGQPFVAFLDADDIWLPDKTERQIELMTERPEAIGTHTRVFNFEQEPDDRDREETERSKDDPSVEDLIDYHWICPSTLVVRRQALADIRFEEAIRHSEDMLFLADLRLAGPLRLVDEPLVAKRTHPGQQSGEPWHRLYSLESRVEWCRTRAEKLGRDRADAMLDELGRRMVALLEDRYWRRQFDGFQEARRRVSEAFPDLLAASPVADRRIWPGWVYRLRDGLSSSR